MKPFFINIAVLFYFLFSISLVDASSSINFDVSVDTEPLMQTSINSLNFNTELQYTREEYVQWKARRDEVLVLLTELKKIKKINIAKYTPEQYSINFSYKKQQVNALKYQCSSYGEDEVLLNDKLKELRIFSKKVANKSKEDIEWLDKTIKKNFKLFFSKKGQCLKLTKELDDYLKRIDLMEKKVSLVK